MRCQTGTEQGHSSYNNKRPGLRGYGFCPHETLKFVEIERFVEVKTYRGEIHPLINNYIIEYNIFNNSILGTFRFLATMRFHRQELPPHLGEIVHALNKALATTQTQLSRPMSSGYHIYMENRLWRKPLLMLTIQVWMATLCDTTYGGNSN